MIIITVNLDDPTNIIVKKEIKFDNNTLVDQQIAETGLACIIFDHVNEIVDSVCNLTQILHDLSNEHPEIKDLVHKFSENEIDNFILSNFIPDNPDEDMG